MKIFYALYDRTFGYTRAIVAIIAGLILVAWPETIKNIIVYVLGGIILATGIISFVYQRKLAKEQSERQSPLQSANGIVNIIFGLILILFPSFFSSIIMFLFGAVLLLFGIGALVSFFSTRKLANTPWGFAVIPALVTTCGIGLFFFPNTSGNTLFVVFGIALLVFGISELIETYLVRRRIQEAGNKHKHLDNNIEIEDVPYQEL